MGTYFAISILLAILFMGIVIWKRKSAPISISAMVYDFKFKWTWTIWLWLVTLFMAPTLIEKLPEDFKFVGFLMLGCLVFTSAMPVFIKDKTKTHNAFGIAACILSQIVVLIMQPWLLLLWLLYLILCIYVIVKDTPDCIRGSGIFFAELICWLSTVLCLI